MAKMRAAEAAVHVLPKEGVNHAFGLPGAAINPFYAAMRTLGGISHVLARHVEGASHMGQGATRVRAGEQHWCMRRHIRTCRNRHDYGALLGVGRFDPDSLHHGPSAARAAL